MKHLVGLVIIVVLFVGACDKAKPTLTGRLYGPSDMALFMGCTQNSTGPCTNKTEQLLLIANSLGNDLRVFDVNTGNFFHAIDPLFPLSIPVGDLPKNLAIDPHGEYAFVVNSLSQNISLVELVNQDGSYRLVEVDTDANPDTNYCGVKIDSASTDPISDRCRAGVSRVELGTDAQILPEDIVVPSNSNWDKKIPLPVYVSLTATGQIAVLNFQYPDPDTETPPRLDLVETLTVGGNPSGLALTKDGSKLFVANEGSDSIQMFDFILNRTPTDIPIGGHSRRLALVPNNDKLYEDKLYVVPTASANISVVDVDTKSLCESCNAACPTENFASNPLVPGIIRLENIPRSITFVSGHSITFDEAEYKGVTGSEAAVMDFAYVSNLDGGVYIVDALNTCAIRRKSSEPTVSGSLVRYASLVDGGISGEMIFLTTNANPKDRVYLLFEGSDAMLAFFPEELVSTNYLLYQ